MMTLWIFSRLLIYSFILFSIELSNHLKKCQASFDTIPPDEICVKGLHADLRKTQPVVTVKSHRIHLIPRSNPIEFEYHIKIDVGTLYSNNVGHYVKDSVFTLALWLAKCIPPRSAICHMEHLPVDHFYRHSKESSIDSHIGDSGHFTGTAFLTAILLENFCKKQLFQIASDQSYNITYHISNEHIEKFYSEIGYLYTHRERAIVFRTFRSGAQYYFNIDPQNWKKIGDPNKLLVVAYTREDTKRRIWRNAPDVLNRLEKALPSFEYKIVPKLQALSFLEQYNLFASTSVLISTHGSWHVNTMFMPDTSIVFSIENVHLFSQMHWYWEHFERWYSTDYLKFLTLTNKVNPSFSSEMVLCKVDSTYDHKSYETTDYNYYDPINVTISNYDQMIEVMSQYYNITPLAI